MVSSMKPKDYLEKHRQEFEKAWLENPSVDTSKASAFRWWTEGWCKSEDAAEANRISEMQCDNCNSHEDVKLRIAYGAEGYFCKDCRGE